MMINNKNVVRIYACFPKSFVNQAAAYLVLYRYLYFKNLFQGIFFMLFIVSPPG